MHAEWKYLDEPMSRCSSLHADVVRRGAVAAIRSTKHERRAAYLPQRGGQHHLRVVFQIEEVINRGWHQSIDTIITHKTCDDRCLHAGRSHRGKRAVRCGSNQPESLSAQFTEHANPP